MVDEKDTAEGKNIDPRETPAFRGVLKQLEESRRANEEMAAKLHALTDAAEKQRSAEERKTLEQKGKYEEAMQAYQREADAQVAKARAEIEALRVSAEQATVERELAAAGVLGKPMTYLANDYRALADKPPINEWLETIKTHPDYSMFFTRPRSPQPGDPGGRAATSSGTPSWDDVKANLSSPDPAKRHNADLAVRKHMEDHGKLPW